MCATWVGVVTTLSSHRQTRDTIGPDERCRALRFIRGMWPSSAATATKTVRARSGATKAGRDRHSGEEPVGRLSTPPLDGQAFSWRADSTPAPWSMTKKQRALSPDIISRSDDDVQLTATTITVDGSIAIHQPQMDGDDSFPPLCH